MPLLTFDEATELAFFGATVLHPSAMQPAMQHSSLDVRVKNSYNRYHLSPSNMMNSLLHGQCIAREASVLLSKQSMPVPSEGCSFTTLDEPAAVAVGKQRGRSSPEKGT